jgi:hypothetical protein
VAATVDTELAHLREDVARVGATLVAFEQDATVVLLDAAPLEGVTAERWRRCRTAVADVFGWYHALGDLLDRAGRSARRDLPSLLRAASVTLDGAPIGVADRDLLDGSRRVQRATPADALARMTATFDEVRATLAAVESAWRDVPARLDDARARPDGPPADELDELARAARTDPLGFDHARLDAALGFSSDRHDEVAELIGRLRAYAAKADRLGLLERAEISAAHDRADRSLRAAPVDLVDARALVDAYRDRVNGSRP